VLTCAHVLAAHPYTCPQETTFTVGLVGLVDGREVSARAVLGAWVPPTQDNGGDVALLQLDRELPDRCVAAMRRLPDSWPEGDLPAKAYGRSPRAEVWANVRITGWGGGGGEWVQLVKDKRGPRIARGFSGAGVKVVDGNRAYVVGVVVGVVEVDRDESDPGVSWMVPMDMVVRHLRVLTSQVEVWPPRDVGFARLIEDFQPGRVQTPLMLTALIVVVVGGADSPASVALSSGGVPPGGLVTAKPEGRGIQMRIDASGKTAEEVAARVADALGVEAEGARGLSDYQGSMSGTSVIVEGIDEASDPDAVVSQVVTPLVRRDARVIAAFYREATPSAVALGIDALASVVDKVGEAERAARKLHRRAAARVAGVPQVPVRAAMLRTQLAEIRAAAAGGQQVVTALAAAVSDAERAHQAVRDVTTRLNEALTQHSAVRGRLQSYQAMAVNGGLAEDIDLGELYEAAWQPLWHGRCDLAVAEEAVARYAQAIHDKLDRRGAA
jgi:hypothetical protein